MVVATRRTTAARPTPPPPDLAAHPSEEELITSFLRPRLAADGSGGAPRALVHDADVYSAGPDELTRGFDPAVAGNGDRAWYFFSAVRAKTSDGQRRARTVGTGGGCWHSEAGAKPVVDGAGRCLGHRRSFSFVTKAGVQRVRSGWLMVELGLDDADGVALCKIYFSPRARTSGGAASAASSAGRKRKQAAAGDPAASSRRGRRPTEAGAPRRDDAVTADAESTQDGGGLADESSASSDDEDEDGLWKEGMFLSWWMRNRDRLVEEHGIVDRSDEELQKTLGLDKVMKLLNRDYGDSLLIKPSAPENP
ncbi:hypothetical protein GQ55_5G207300 [Panicum hallii var. hallii]|uniref:NAC domain-containing protein n=1 Tax=Panicum hallii var. hallii TaxID=1504633 RepID=A0A2T7DIH0_9POAL|nr:hypothetical protein GQ55_5G207300 [Panicum hallii var. hallii]